MRLVTYYPGNLSAIITVLFASIAGLPVPFVAVQLLFINLVTDSLPALAIGMEPGNPDILKRKPRDLKASLLDKPFVTQISTQGFLISLSVITAFLIGLKDSPAIACTMAFSTLTFARLLHGFNCRSQHSIFKIGFKNNWYSLAAFALGHCTFSLNSLCTNTSWLICCSTIKRTRSLANRDFSNYSDSFNSVGKSNQRK